MVEIADQIIYIDGPANEKNGGKVPMYLLKKSLFTINVEYDTVYVL